MFFFQNLVLGLERIESLLKERRTRMEIEQVSLTCPVVSALLVRAWSKRKILLLLLAILMYV
jgi:hypothetical protein